MRLFDNSNKIKVGILLLLALGICVGLRAETRYPAKMNKIKSLVGNRLIKRDQYSAVGISTRGDHRLPTEVLLRQDEFLIDTNIVHVSAAADQKHPAVAFDGTNYLVVWHDQRNGSGVRDIFGARVSQDGVVLDPSGIAISIETSGAAVPSIAFDGTNYLVVWQDYRNGSADIYGSRVTQDGVVLDPSGIAISTGTSYKLYPKIAFDGINYLVCWQDDRNGTSDIYGTRVTQDGVVLDPSGIAISTAENEQGSAAIAFDGTNFLVSWGDMRNGFDCDIYGTRVTRDGVVLDSSGIAISAASSHQYSPSVAFDGANYFVCWTDERNSSSSRDIYGARVSQDGVVLDSSGVVISTADNYQWESAIAFDGTNYFVAWADKRNFASGDYQHDIYGARVSQDDTVLDPTGIILSTAANYQLVPSVAFNGTHYLCVWADGRRAGSQDDIYGARVSQDGTVLDPSGIAISTAAYDQNAPSVASDGTNYLVVWHDQRNGYYEIYGARVNQDGVVLDPSGIAISQQRSLYPAVAFDGTNYMTVWADLRFGLWYIYGTRVSQDGVVLDPSGIAIDTSVSCYSAPSIAFDGTNYLVVWEVYNVSHEIFGTRVSQDGVVLDPEFIRISFNHPDAQLEPSVAFDGINYLVVWRDNRISGSGWEIYGARVSQDGVVLDSSGIAIDTTMSYKKHQSVAFDGVNYQVVWVDRRNSEWDIYGAKVNTAGNLVDTFLVSAQSGNQFTPSLVHGPDDQIFITYSGWIDYINTHPANTMHIWGKLYPNTGIEEITSNIKYGDSYLLQIFPNPFTKSTIISYSSSVINDQLPMTSDLQCPALRIYDASGRLVKTFSTNLYSLDNSVQVVSWDGTDDVSRKLPAGVYFISIGNGDNQKVEKAILLR